MNGATAEFCVKMIKQLNRRKIKRIGANQYRFLVFKKSQNSFKMATLDISPS